MRPEHLFLVRYERVREIASAGTFIPPDALEASAILRQLFLDGSDSLVDRVNRQRRVKLQFRTPDNAPEIELLNSRLGQNLAFIWVSWDSMGRPPLMVNRDGFLKAPLVYLSPDWITVRDIVKMCANRLGGVHSGDPRTDSFEEQRMRSLTRLFMGDSAALYLNLFMIARCALHGLEPLYEAVKREVTTISADTPTATREEYELAGRAGIAQRCGMGSCRP